MNYIHTVRGTGNSDNDFVMKCNNHAGLLQVSYGSGASGTIKLYGRITTDHKWYELDSVSGDSVVEVAIMPHMRISFISISGTVTASVMEAI